jgi:hypothetical protein
MNRRSFLLLGAMSTLAPAAWAQNLVEGETTGVTAPPVQLTDRQVVDLLARVPDYRTAPRGREVDRIAAKLDRHVAEFVAGFPYQAFHNTLGISGYETYFNHPDHMFYALSTALPYLTRATAEQTRRFLAEQLAKNPPYAPEGWDNRAGNPREAYDVPAGLRVSGRGKALGALGVYAFWAYCRYSGDRTAAGSHWERVKSRMQSLLTGAYPLDPSRRDYAGDEAQKLNGDLAGAIGLVRLARINADSAAEKEALAAAKRLLELRVNLERVNPHVLEKTSSSTKHLHVNKLARYCDMVPEVGEAVRSLTDGCGPARLKAFREARNGWHMAFGERLIGGENYVSPPHLSHALFAGAAFVELLSSEQMLSLVDVPWCKGDFYFIEKCVQALWSAAGRPWRV